MLHKVRLNDLEDVREFVEAASECKCDVDISYDRVLVDAKSIMGLFSLDLSKPLQLRIHADANDVPEEIRADLIEFMVEKQDGSAI